MAITNTEERCSQCGIPLAYTREQLRVIGETNNGPRLCSSCQREKAGLPNYCPEYESSPGAGEIDIEDTDL